MALFRAVKLNRSYEPKPRLWHYAAAVGGKCFVFAGRTVNFVKNKRELSSTIEVIDQYLEQWRVLKTTGSPPRGLSSGGCCVSPSGDLYVYGGYDGSDHRGGLYKLTALEWTQISAESERNGPMNKIDCKMVCFSDKKEIAIIGGHGLPLGPPQPGSSFIEDQRYTDGSGWTNEIHCFDTESSKLSH